MPGLTKHPIDRTRVRTMPRQFGAVDRNLVYQAWTQRLSPEALAVYVFLICVSDTEGLSYYSDRRVGELLNLPAWQIDAAREVLRQQGLILYQQPLYQVLALPERA